MGRMTVSVLGKAADGKRLEMGSGGFGRLDDVDDGKGVGAIKYERQISPYLMLLVPQAMNLVDLKISTIMSGKCMWCLA